MPDTGHITNILQPGDLFLKKYVVERLLGRGGMGEVYLVRHTILETNLALKLLFPDIVSRNSQSVKRFIREAQLACKVKHPNLIAVHDAGEEDGLYYIIMDYVSGGSVRDYLKREHKVPPARALEIIRQIASALKAAYAHQMVHRDIKPDNIMFSGDGTAKLADLGIAKSLNEHDTMLTLDASSVFGTPAYMSPEQARESSNVDCRADIYSLGIVLYEMLTGKPPYKGSLTQVLSQVLAENDIPDIRTEDESIPKSLASLIADMTRKKLEQRISTPSKLLNRIADVNVVLQGGVPRWFGGKPIDDSTVTSVETVRGVEVAENRKHATAKPRPALNSSDTMPTQEGTPVPGGIQQHITRHKTSGHISRERLNRERMNEEENEYTSGTLPTMASSRKALWGRRVLLFFICLTSLILLGGSLMYAYRHEQFEKLVRYIKGEPEKAPERPLSVEELVYNAAKDRLSRISKEREASCASYDGIVNMLTALRKKAEADDADVLEIIGSREKALQNLEALREGLTKLMGSCKAEKEKLEEFASVNDDYKKLLEDFEEEGKLFDLRLDMEKCKRLVPVVNEDMSTLCRRMLRDAEKCISSAQKRLESAVDCDSSDEMDNILAEVGNDIGKSRKIMADRDEVVAKLKGSVMPLVVQDDANEAQKIRGNADKLETEASNWKEMWRLWQEFHAGGGVLLQRIKEKKVSAAEAQRNELKKKFENIKKTKEKFGFVMLNGIASKLLEKCATSDGNHDKLMANFRATLRSIEIQGPEGADFELSMRTSGIVLPGKLPKSGSMKFDSLPPGVYDLKAHMLHHEDIIKRVELGGMNEKVSLKFTPKMYSLAIVSQPYANVNVYQGRKPVFTGITGADGRCVVPPLVFGTYNIRVDKELFLEEKADVTLDDNKTHSVLLKEDEAARRRLAELEAKRKAEEAARKAKEAAEAARKARIAAEEAARKAEAERKRIEAEIAQKKKAEEEARKREEEKKRKEAEEARKKAEEEAKRKAEEERIRAEEEKRKAEEERIRAEEEERKRVEAEKKAEEERIRAEAEAKKKAEEEERRAKAEAKRKAEEEKARQRLEAKQRAEEEKIRAREAKKRAEEERREAKKRAEEERKKAKQAEAEAKKKAAEEAKRRKEEEKKRAEEEAKRKAEEEAKRKAEEEKARQLREIMRTLEEAKRKAAAAAEEEAKRKAEEERIKKEQEEKLRKEQKEKARNLLKDLGQLRKKVRRIVANEEKLFEEEEKYKPIEKLNVDEEYKQILDSGKKLKDIYEEIIRADDAKWNRLSSRKENLTKKTWNDALFKDLSREADRKLNMREKMTGVERSKCMAEIDELVSAMELIADKRIEWLTDARMSRLINEPPQFEKVHNYLVGCKGLYSGIKDKELKQKLRGTMLHHVGVCKNTLERTKMRGIKPINRERYEGLRQDMEDLILILEKDN